MSFLGRVAVRANAGTANAGVTGARPTTGEPAPAMVSASPLVQFDQRLTLPGRSEIAPVTQAFGVTSGELGAVDAPSAFEGESPATALPSAPAGSVAREGSFAPRQGSEVASNHSAAPAGSAPNVGSSAGEPRLATLVPSVSVSTAVSVPGIASNPGAAFDSAHDTGQARGTPSSEVSPARFTVRDFAVERPASAGAESVAEITPPARSVLDAIARVDAWLRTDSREGGTSAGERPAPRNSVEPAALNLSATVSAHGPEADGSQGFSNAPMISIGKLEIEVVPPVPRARSAETQRAPGRRVQAASRTSGSAAFSAPRAFGWRQR